MRLMLEASQAGNRSGTGRYTVELLRALANLTEDELTLSALWPINLPQPNDCPDVHWETGSSAPLSRLLRTSRGVSRSSTTPVDFVHYPANFGPFQGNEPFVLTVHDLSFMRYPQWFRWNRAVYYRNAARRSVNRARRIIADSNATADDIHTLLNIDTKCIDVIPLGVEATWQPATETKIATAKKTYNLPKHYFLYTGTLEPRKNIPRIIAAWEALAKKFDWDLVLAGRIGWKAHEIEQALARSPHKDRIHRLGYVDDTDLPAILSGASAFVWPSLFEGFGLPPLEAMACGTPVIASNASSIPEVTGDAALLVDPYSTDALREAMGAVANSPALAQELSQKGLQRVQQFTWARTARMTLETYRRAMR